MDGGVDLSDIKDQGWLARNLPRGFQPYIKLMRIDRPVGIWLAMFPVLASLVLSQKGIVSAGDLLLFSLGATIMRGAGCTVNDCFDRKFDAEVRRTRSRPLACGSLSLSQAAALLFLQLMTAASLLIWLTPESRILAIGCLPMMMIYPLLKRVTHWPQAFLGATFNWGVLVAGMHISGSLSLGICALWLGSIFWQLGYDTIYAYCDREDDLRIGVRSTATRLDKHGRVWVGCFYLAALFFWISAGALQEAGAPYYIMMLPIALMFAFQVNRFEYDSPECCIPLFKSNSYVGLLLLVGASASFV
ncbi:4-hydroxybenzoate octaprenyltransferase [Pseudomonas mosselii]|uniref:4-hydroxybenzoate octaprenyltransferase n=1 Tax=Pseudomonas mosselii TaxID=78327 RepID=UPI000C12CF2E|nr:4-hydroxybenzoate octaprenyltransferase [Pseudomonas mosselii]